MKKIIKILVILPLLFSCGDNTKIMNEKEYAKYYQKELQKVFTEVDFKITGYLAITGKHNDLDYQHFLDNSYNEYKQNPDNINNIIAKYINASVEIYAPKAPINMSRIVPVIKSRKYLDEMKKLMEKDGKNKVFYEDYNEDLVIMYAEDKPNSISYFNNESYKEIGIPKEELLNNSIENLLKMLPNIKKDSKNGTYMIIADGDYEATLILWKGLWTKENFDVDGDFIIAIPNRDLLLITGSENKEGIDRIRKIAIESHKTGSYEISPYLYKWNGEKFERYE
ncbi:DUF1444 family protein [Fusobacterium sp. PH5-44]|uniref:DUF1444 family protein n=1 Tax=unclassified Fusobacterium TaxID=2648384 RepID=UPI003D1F9263